MRLDQMIHVAAAEVKEEVLVEVLEEIELDYGSRCGQVTKVRARRPINHNTIRPFIFFRSKIPLDSIDSTDELRIWRLPYQLQRSSIFLILYSNDLRLFL